MFSWTGFFNELARLPPEEQTGVVAHLPDPPLPDPPFHRGSFPSALAYEAARHAHAQRHWKAGQHALAERARAMGLEAEELQSRNAVFVQGRPAILAQLFRGGGVARAQRDGVL